MTALLLSFLTQLGQWVWRTSLQASLAIFLVVLVQAILRRRLPARWITAFWLLVMIRLAMPWLPASPLSVYHVLPRDPVREEPLLRVEEKRNTLRFVAKDDPLLSSPQPVTSRNTSVATLQPGLPEAAGRPAPMPATPLWRAWVQAHPYTALWLAGMSVLILALMVRSVRLARRIARVRPVTESRWLNLLEDGKAAMGLRMPVALVETAHVHGPMLLGFIRPRLLMPAGLLERLTDDQARCIFMHELAHIRRGDILLGWLMALLLVVHWFNPLVWLASLRLRADRELACDAAALDRLGAHQRQDYGRTLVQLAENMSAAPLLPILAGIVEHETDLKRRLVMITRFKRPQWLASLSGLMMLLFLGVCILTAPMTAKGIRDKIDYPFVDDPQLHGVWTSVDYVATPNLFVPGQRQFLADLYFQELHVHKDGTWNCVVGGNPSPVTFKWTKGMLLDWQDQTAEHYEFRTIGGKQYLFREWKAGDYTFRNQMPKYYVLVKTDREAARMGAGSNQPRAGANSAGRTPVKNASTPSKSLPSDVPAGTIQDKVDYPYVNDPELPGTWQSVAYIRTPEEFVPGRSQVSRPLFIQKLQVAPDGTWTINGKPGGTLKWTRGLLLNTHTIERTASQYAIREMGGRKYMFMEWKNGDYTYRHQKPWYYVLVKVGDEVVQAESGTTQQGGREIKYSPTSSKPLPLGIHGHPQPANFSRPLNQLPAYNPNSGANWQVDLRSRDVSKFDVRGRIGDLMFADFDSKTKWPAALPEVFDPNRIMDIGRNPGLGVRRLHAKGITGKGVGLAIIDQNLLVDHAEYKDRLRHYEEIHWPETANGASMHGSAVASIAVGKSVGVAPEADLYYIAEQHGEFTGGAFAWDFAPLAQSIHRVLDLNRALPSDKKIRVISISVGWRPERKGYAETMAAVERAKKEGVFIVSSSLEQTFGLRFHGLGRDPLTGPDQAQSHLPGLFWQNSFFSNPAGALPSDTLLIPMDSRCTASPTGCEDYVFYRNGGWSWSIPYAAGLYALACQVRPDVTPELFWKTALETGETIQVSKDGKTYPLGRIAQPERLIEKLSAAK